MRRKSTLSRHNFILSMLSAYRNRIFSSVKILVSTVIFFAALTQGWFSALSSVFLMKPGVHCQAKRQNKFENIHLSEIYRQNTKQRKLLGLSVMHFLQLRHEFSISILGQYTVNLALALESSMPRCPACSSVSTG